MYLEKKISLKNGDKKSNALAKFNNFEEEKKIQHDDDSLFPDRKVYH
jgi:hypothetical protein